MAWDLRISGNDQDSRPVMMAAFTSPIACVISISRGQHSVQLKIVWQR